MLNYWGSSRGWNLAESVSSGLKPHEASLCGAEAPSPKDGF